MASREGSAAPARYSTTGPRASPGRGQRPRPYDPGTGELLALRWGLDGEFAGIGRPDPEEVAAARVRAEALAAEEPLRPGLATVVGVIATDVTLSKAECQKVCGLGHDGLARALHPVHTLLDGDTLFTLATGERPPPDLVGLLDLMSAAGDCVTRAVGHAMLSAESVQTTADLRSWRDAFPLPQPDSHRDVCSAASRPGWPCPKTG